MGVMIRYQIDNKARKEANETRGNLLPDGSESTWIDAGDDVLVRFDSVAKLLVLCGPSVNLTIEFVNGFSVGVTPL